MNNRLKTILNLLEGKEKYPFPEEYLYESNNAAHLLQNVPTFHPAGHSRNTYAQKALHKADENKSKADKR